MLREFLMILFVTCSTLGSQLLIKRAVTGLAHRQPGLEGWSWLASAIQSPYLIAAVIVQGIGFLVWVVVISRMKLGVAFAISGGCFYLLLAALGYLLFGERLSPSQWLGIACLSVGVVLVSGLGARAA